MIDRHTAAAKRRKQMLADLRHVVKMCTCTWPLDVYRNGDGHSDECPAHEPLSERTEIQANKP